MKQLTHASVFSGIGGPEVAATMLGWENLFHCEINPFGKAVLDYWYPNAKSYDDITKTDFSEWRGRVNVLTGGFPCQPFSYAGQRRGATDDRYLWPFMFRCIDQIRPDWVVAENVGGILTMVEQGQVSEMASTADLFGATDGVRGYKLRETFTLQRICDDLESHGYSVQPILIPACAVGAPHRRDRVFIVGCRVASDTDGGADGRNTRQDESQGREERLQERHEIRQPNESSQVRPEGARTMGNTESRYGKSNEHGEQGTCEQSTQVRKFGGTSGVQVTEQSSADTDSSRQPTPEQQSERARQTVQRESGIESLDGIERPCTSSASTDSISSGEGTPRKSGSPESIWSDQDKQPELWGAETEWNNRFYALLRYATDPDNVRLQHDMERGSKTGLFGSSGEGGENGISEQIQCTPSDGEGGSSADTNCERLERPSSVRIQGHERRGQYNGIRVSPWDCGENGGICGERWADFPTVSPVHRGNDGIPFPLDSLTISSGKWRTEALKAYGNAIVPQVMYEIFRAIALTYEQ